MEGGEIIEYRALKFPSPPPRRGKSLWLAAIFSIEAFGHDAPSPHKGLTVCLEPSGFCEPIDKFLVCVYTVRILKDFPPVRVVCYENRHC